MHRGSDLESISRGDRVVGAGGECGFCGYAADLNVPSSQVGAVSETNSVESSSYLGAPLRHWVCRGPSKPCAF